MTDTAPATDAEEADIRYIAEKHRSGSTALTSRFSSKQILPLLARLDAERARAEAAEARLATAREALQGMLDPSEPLSVHIGYDDGVGGGNFVYADAVLLNGPEAAKARAALDATSLQKAQTSEGSP